MTRFRINNQNLITLFITLFSVYFFVWFLLYKSNINTLAIQSEDTVPALFVPLAIIKERTLYLDSYYSTMLQAYPHPDDRDYTKGLLPFYLRKVDSHYLSAFPVITPLLALPVYQAAILLNVNFDWNTLAVLSHIVGALIVATSAYLFYLLLRNEFKLDTQKSMLLLIVYAFGTINFALVSQAMWQHGTVQLFTILGLIFYMKYLYRDEKINAVLYLIYFGFFMTLAVLSRPTALLVFGILAATLVLNKNFIKNSYYIFLGALAPLAFFLWYNRVYYVGIENQGYSSQIFKNWLGDFPLSFLGVWLSPSKGILIYSPVLIFSIVGLYLAVKKKVDKRNIFLLSALIVFLHTLIISFWKHWFGGWSFGYRMSSDILPFLVLLIIPWITTPHSIVARKVFLSTLVLSIVIELYGMVFFDGIWHAAYDRGYQDTRWLWSIKDSEIAFNIRRVMVKAGLLEKACPTCEPAIINQ